MRAHLAMCTSGLNISRKMKNPETKAKAFVKKVPQYTGNVFDLRPGSTGYAKLGDSEFRDANVHLEFEVDPLLTDGNKGSRRGA